MVLAEGPPWPCWARPPAGAGGRAYKVRLPGGGFLARQRMWEKQHLGLIKQHRQMPEGRVGGSNIWHLGSCKFSSSGAQVLGKRVREGPRVRWGVL